MLTPVLSQGPQGEALGCSPGGQIQGTGTLSLSGETPMSKLGPAVADLPCRRAIMTLPITSRVVVSLLVHQGSYNKEP